MRTDAQIRDDVIRELAWDPRVSQPEAIGVAVSDGAVTLTGHASTYAQKLAGAKAAERVEGVKAVADDVEVHLRGSPRDDSDVARAIAHILSCNVQIPVGRVEAGVQGGLVTLGGSVEHDFQRREVERMVRHVSGVVAVTDNISVTPPASAENVADRIQEALKRQAEVDAGHIRVVVSNRTAMLYGQVHSLREESAAKAAAAAAPGVAFVVSHLAVSP